MGLCWVYWQNLLVPIWQWSLWARVHSGQESRGVSSSEGHRSGWGLNQLSYEQRLMGMIFQPGKCQLQRGCNCSLWIQGNVQENKAMDKALNNMLWIQCWIALFWAGGWTIGGWFPFQPKWFCDSYEDWTLLHKRNIRGSFWLNNGNLSLINPLLCRLLIHCYILCIYVNPLGALCSNLEQSF